MTAPAADPHPHPAAAGLAGLAIAFIAIIADRSINVGARAARICYGLEEQGG